MYFAVERPPNWKDMPPGTTCSLITLTAADKEYNDVKSKFEATMSALAAAAPPLMTASVRSLANVRSPAYVYSGAQYNNIVKIERVQNVMLYAQYVTKKKTMDQRNAASNEKELFHGCPNDVVDKITHQGFNRSFAGKNGIISIQLLLIVVVYLNALLIIPLRGLTQGWWKSRTILWTSFVNIHVLYALVG